MFEICKPYVGEARDAHCSLHDDAANLLKVYAGAPTVVLGPGEAAMAHQTDEYASMERIRQSVAIYGAFIRDWTNLPDDAVVAELNPVAFGDLAAPRIDVCSLPSLILISRRCMGRGARGAPAIIGAG